MGFQTTINDYQAPGQPGDFASLNPFSSVLAGNNALVAPAGGLAVGNFFWVGPDGSTSQSFVAGWQIAFLGRNMQALITDFLGEATLVVPQGFMVTGFNGGDFYANFPAGAHVGDYVFADPNDGTPVSNTANSAPTLGTATASAGFSGTANLASGSAVLTVATVVHGIVSVGDVVTDSTTAGNIPAGTTILNQLTGTAGGVGTYTMSANAAGAGTGDTIACTSANVLVTAVASGALNVGDKFTGTAVSAGTTIVNQVAPFNGVANTTNASGNLTVTAVPAGVDLLRKGATITGPNIPASTTISSQTSGTPGGVGVYVMSANATATAVGQPVKTSDTLSGTGLYQISPSPQVFGALAVGETITVAGTAQATGFRVRGTYQAPQGAAVAPNGVWKISAPVNG
jgi:hypothetical protein